MILDSRFDARLRMVLIVPLVLGACGDDGSDSAGDLGSASAEDGPELTTGPAQTDGDTGGSGSGTSGSAMTSAGDTTGSGSGPTTGIGTGMGTDTDTGTDAGIGTDTGGTMVDSCNKCGPDELCVELTEYAGPADGGGPAVSYTCHDIPAACRDAITCECAGFLCPGEGGGAEATCSTDGEVLACTVAYP